MLAIIREMKNAFSYAPLNPTFRKIHLSVTTEAARKGTREKARKKKVKVEVQKVGFIPHNQRNKEKLNLYRQNKHVDDSWKANPTDDCYVGKYYKWKIYSVSDAIQCHRETHHPSMYNVPNAPLNVHIELNMKAEKANRFIDNFQKVAMIPYKFDHGEERRILVFTKTMESLLEAREAGATLVGGIELIKDIQNGELLISDFQYVIAHPNILPELVSLRGLMKRKFPNPKNGTLGPDLKDIITKFSNGIEYKAEKDENQPDFASITTCIGTLNMKSEELEGNLVSLLKDVNSNRPKREGKFITKVIFKSPPSSEQLRINPFVYIEEEYIKPKSIYKTSYKDVDENSEEMEIKI
ncbi:39S ribosomal protein L1, mitochondrial [Condylostylus longicornis]|uniref:39S ribosomal protein L1, mitochondrial n=1 Tax=Condylostylus longicornis TaxID=2530218 RepID=UPI00244E1842|nr:39S ribosomal protein L1, mitochondrial [Condylostylus longicornis]